MASLIAGVGWVIVSLRRSTACSFMGLHHRSCRQSFMAGLEMDSQSVKRQTPRERPEESASRKGDESVCRTREVKEEMNNLH